MAQLYLRLILTNGNFIETGSDWVDVHNNKLPAKVGAIFYSPESSRMFSEGGDEGEEDVAEDVTETTAPHYEVWAFPDKGSALDKANETLCRRVPATSVLYAEEIWPLSLASRIVKERVSEMAELAQDMMAEVQTPPPAPAPAPVQAPLQAQIQQPAVEQQVQYVPAIDPQAQYTTQPVAAPYAADGGQYVNGGPLTSGS